MSQEDNERLELAIDLAREAGGRASGAGGMGGGLDDDSDATRVGLPPVAQAGAPADGYGMPQAGAYGMPQAGGYAGPQAGAYGVPQAGGYAGPQAGAYGVPQAAPPPTPERPYGHIAGPGAARAPGSVQGAAGMRRGAGMHGGSGTAVRPFSIGELLSQSVSIYTPRLLSFIAITTLAYVPSIVVFGLLIAGMSPEPSPEAAEPGTGMGSTGMIFGGVAGWLLVLAGGLFSCALITGTVFRQMRGDPPSLSEMMRMGLGRIGRLAGLGVILFLAGLGLGIASILLSMVLGPLMIIVVIGVVVLGVVLHCSWWVLLPVAVVESVPLMQCFERSAFLTRGNRLQIFGLTLLLGVVGYGLQVLVEHANDTFGAILVTALLIAFSNFYLVVMAVSYHELRMDKEDVELGDLLRVFS